MDGMYVAVNSCRDMLRSERVASCEGFIGYDDRWRFCQ